MLRTLLHLWTVRTTGGDEDDHLIRENWGRDGWSTSWERRDRKQVRETATVGIKPGSGKSKREDTD